MREDPATMSEGTKALGKYGSGFSLAALFVNILVYLPLLLLSVYGVCNRRAKFDNIQPEKIENEE